MRRERGFTLIELLIVVAIIGVIAAIAIPNLLNAINRGRQKATMGDMRTIATAIEAYAVDYGRYPRAITSRANLATFISPTYIKFIPMSDGWNNMWYMRSDANGTEYSIASYGRDATANVGSWTTPGTTSTFDADIVYSNGTFWKYPSGIQTD
ncbi:MAG: prepilin-type N-terminal cleavage/methylation domain-containing protein [bacterium]|nr:prepilin-type N-terminal cleavage/methylation domain-containing protein [bacterium]